MTMVPWGRKRGQQPALAVPGWPILTASLRLLAAPPGGAGPDTGI